MSPAGTIECSLRQEFDGTSDEANTQRRFLIRFRETLIEYCMRRKRVNFQPSLRDSGAADNDPGIETPGYVR